MKRRKFIKTTATAGIIGALTPIKLLKALPKVNAQYFGISSFIENNPEAVFIMRTSVDQKINSSAMKAAGSLFAKTVFVSKDEGEPGAIPTYNLITLKPNLTGRRSNKPKYTVEGSMGIVTDAYFVEGVIERLKELGSPAGNMHMVETNYNHNELIDGGYIDMATRTGVNLKDYSSDITEFNEEDIIWRDVPNGKYFRKIPYLYPMNAENSYLINISKLKAHDMGLTLCAKNIQGGIVHPYQQHCRNYPSDIPVQSSDHLVSNALNNLYKQYRDLHKTTIPRWDKPGSYGGIWQEVWAARCLDNNTVTKAGLHIIEGIYGRDGDFLMGPGPDGTGYSGLAKDYMSNVIIFGKNPFNVDIIGHWIGGHEPGNFGLFHLAIERGLSTKLNPIDIPLYEWKSDGTILEAALTDFDRTPLVSHFLQQDYNGGDEPYFHLCDEEFDYNAVSVSDDNLSRIPESFYLSQNYPNPFNPTTTIEYQLTKAGNVKIEIFDISGRVIDVIADRYHNAGSHTVVWHAESFPSGVYFYRLLTARGLKQTKKMTLVR